jgi:hypothetical protein
VFFVPSSTTGSGATYPTYTSGASYKLAETNYFVGSIAINPATQSANVVDEVLTDVRIPLGFFKTILVNHCRRDAARFRQHARPLSDADAILGRSRDTAKAARS